MQKMIIAVVGSLVLSAVCLADGPAKQDLNQLALEKKMGQIIIPEIDFRQANIQDIVKFLQAASVKFDKSAEVQGVKGVIMIVRLGEKDVREITMSARYISLLDAMKTITRVAGLTYRIDGQVVVIEPKTIEPKK